MSSIIEALKENNILISVTYYGQDDLATSWEIRTMIEHPIIFNGFYKRFPLTDVSSIDDFFVYMLSLKFSQMNELVPLIRDDSAKELISMLSSEATDALSSMETGSIIKFIDSNIEQVFDDEFCLYDLGEQTIDLITKFSQGISKRTFEFLVDHHPYLLIDHYEEFDKTFEKYPDLFDRLLASGKFEEIFNWRFIDILNIFSYILIRKKSKLKDIAKRKVDELYAEIEQMTVNYSGRQILEAAHYARNFYDFLNKIRSPLAGTFKKTLIKTESDLDEYLVNEGQESTFEIPVDKLLDYWTSQKLWQNRLLFLTHAPEIVDEQPMATSRLSKCSEGKRSLIDLVSSTTATDDYFTMSHQNDLDALASTETSTFLGILMNSEYVHDFMSLIRSAVEQIEEVFESEESALSNNIGTLDLMLRIIIENKAAEKDLLVSLCYGPAMFICGLMEKLLRITYESLARGKIYFSADRATLRDLLSPSNEYTNRIFSEYHKKHLRFFLLTEGDKRVGYNYRNDLAHLSNNIEKRLSIPFVACLLWLLTDVINSIFLYIHRTQAEPSMENTS